MLTNNVQLSTAIEQHRQELIETVSKRLQQLEGTHYADIDYERHLEREEVFLNVLLQGLAHETPEVFLNFVDQLSDQRANEGYTLQEFQQAFNIVEDTIWEMLVREYAPDQSLIEMLTTFRRFFRAGKDRLAGVYLREADFTKKELEEIQRKFRTYRKMTKHGHL
jgi:hypothetical protein